jgi:hypothetical protein
MTSQRADDRPRVRPVLPVACSAATAASFGLICASAGPVRLAGALILLGSFVGALGIAHQARFAAIGPAIGLALAFLILIGLALAALHALSTVPVALAIGAVTLVAAWSHRPEPPAEITSRRTPVRLAGPAAVGGVVIFAAAAILAVRLSVVSATADSARASSLAVWAYPSGGRLHVGAREPAGHGPAALRIVVIRAGVTAAAWNDVRLAAGQTWQAPPLTMTGAGPTRVVARRGGVVVAAFSIPAPS